jgi:hypothetical protein
MEGNYRLFRQCNGVSWFAHVSAAVYARSSEQVPNQDHITLALPESEAYVIDDEWREAAVAGCTNALDILRKHGQVTASHTILVTRILTNFADTQPSAIELSAFLAVVNSFGLDNKFTVRCTQESGLIAIYTG